MACLFNVGKKNITKNKTNKKIYFFFFYIIFYVSFYNYVIKRRVNFANSPNNVHRLLVFPDAI